MNVSGQKLQSALAWGTARAESTGAGGAITLSSIESVDQTRLTQRVERFLGAYLRRSGITEKALGKVLLSKPRLLGYAFGTCAACMNQQGVASDVGLQGFCSRVCGEMLGGGIANKVAAFEALTRLSTSPEFAAGQKNAMDDWTAQANR